jgi:tripartite-type tricarboxylate transporter receptor subunit TctC
MRISSTVPGLLAALALGVSTLHAGAQTYPAKPVNLIVPWPAGGPSDFVARQIQPDMTRSLGQPVVIDNVGGVGGAMGVQKALNAPADGYTAVLGSPLELVIQPITNAAVKWKSEDLKMAGLLVKAPLVLLARKDLPASTVDELMALAARPGAKELSIANAGTGSMYHLIAEKFTQQTGVRFIHVPYKGTTPMVADLMGGQVDLAFTIFAGNVPALLTEGKVKVIGVTSTTPPARFPQVPALAAHPKLQGFEFDSWAGIQVPRNTPEAAVARLNKAVHDALQNAEVRKAFEASGNVVVVPSTPAELDRLYQAEIARYQAIARSIKLQPQ